MSEMNNGHRPRRPRHGQGGEPVTNPRPNMRRLQRLIDRAAKAATANHLATAALCDESQRLYGAVPGDVDADQIIDSVLGGSGTAAGMSAEEFDAIMRELTERRP